MNAYRVLLRCYPRDFRERFGDDMRRTFHEELARSQSSGRTATTFFWLGTVLHALWFGSLARIPKGITMRSFSFDLRDAIRSLRATPVITAIAIASLALGIGANTALFSILNGLVLKPLPVDHPERLVSMDDCSCTNPIWEQIRPHAHDLFDGAFAWSGGTMDLSTQGERDLVPSAYASGDMFAVLNVHPILGRTFTMADDVRGNGPDGAVAVISDRLWHQRFGGATNVIGQQISLNRRQFTIVGVAPPSFFGVEVGHSVDVFLPISAQATILGSENMLNGRSTWWLDIYLRMKSQQTIDQATVALRSIQAQVREQSVPTDWSVKDQQNFLPDPFKLSPASTGQTDLRSRYQRPLTIVLFVVAAVLLIACANIANLLLARASARRHELSLRLALGASRFRVARQLLAESLILAFVGAAIGLGVAKLGSALIVNQLTTTVNKVTIDLSLDWSVLGFTAGIALLTTLLFGLAPIFGVARLAPNDALKENSRSVTGDRKFGLRNILVVAQLAMSLALVIGAGLFVRTFSTLTGSSLGFDPHHLTVMNVTMGQGVTPDQRTAMVLRYEEAARRAPGVEKAAMCMMAPMGGASWNNFVTVRDGAVLTGRDRLTWMSAITPGWFSTLGMKVMAGRDFEISDRDNAPKVAIVNQAFVKHFIGDGPGVGRVIMASLGGPRDTAEPVAIVGVVNDSVYRKVREGMTPTMFVPLIQAGQLSGSIPLIFRASSGSTNHAVAAALTDVDPRASFTFRSYDDMLSGTLAPERITAILSASFGALALLLAGLGLYGVTSYSVGLRRSEIAVRMALGADAAGVVRRVLFRVGVMVFTGVALGVGLSVWASKYIVTLLFGLPPRDVATMIGAAVLLALTGLIAAWLPAQRAARTNPTEVLRT